MNLNLTYIQYHAGLVELKLLVGQEIKNMTKPLWQYSAVDLRQGIADKVFSVREAVESVTQRMQVENPTLNAVVFDYTEQALLQADATDARLAQGDAPRMLEGVPVTIKVNVDLEGTPTTNGLPVLADNIAPGNSPVVQNLLDAGAIIIGKTNTPELSMRGTTNNPLHGLTKSPWDDRASPGGSSGGAGSACAAGIGPIHHGNDIGGSLRFPASFCGCATVRPTLGRVPAYNPSAVSERGLLSQLMSVQGAICREVKDVRLATEVMSHADPRDPWWAPVPFYGDTIQQPIKVAFTKDAYGYPVHPDILAGLDRAAELLTAAGYQVEEIEVPSIMEAARAWFSVAILEIKEGLDPIAREHGSEAIQNAFDYFYAMSDMVDYQGYMKGVGERSGIIRPWNVLLDEFPLILTPFMMRPTYDYDYDETFAGAKDIFDSAIYSYGINYLGLPAGNVPIGIVDGRPNGVQIVGQRFREDLILDALQVIENDVGVMSARLW